MLQQQTVVLLIYLKFLYSSARALNNHAVRRMRWTPLSVLMISLISPTLSAYVASSNGFCIWPCIPRPAPIGSMQNCEKEVTYRLEESKVAAVRVRATVTVLRRELGELLWRAVDLRFVSLQDLDRLLL